MPRARSAHPSGLWPPDLPPPVPWPPAGPRRRLPYLRSPGPPFYFLKPSHKAPRRPGLVCFLPETPARAHSPKRLRARWAASACARSPARRRALDRSPVQAKLVARACALTAPASFSRRPRGRGQGRAGRTRSESRARGGQQDPKFFTAARLEWVFMPLLSDCFPALSPEAGAWTVEGSTTKAFF